MAASEDSESNDQSILTVAAEEDPSSGWEGPANSDDESRQGNDQENEVVKKTTDETSGGDFPVNEVNNLRDRLISAASLEPGVGRP